MIIKFNNINDDEYNNKNKNNYNTCNNKIENGNYDDIYNIFDNNRCTPK